VAVTAGASRIEEFSGVEGGDAVGQLWCYSVGFAEYGVGGLSNGEMQRITASSPLFRWKGSSDPRAATTATGGSAAATGVKYSVRVPQSTVVRTKEQQHLVRVQNFD